MNCQGTHNPMRPITNYVRVIDLVGARVASRRSDEQHRRPAVRPRWLRERSSSRSRRSRPTLAQPWAGSVDFYITPWGFLKGAAANNATPAAADDGKTYTVLSWSPAVKAPSGKSYVINGYVNDRNQVERVETWLNENIMGDMHIVATYTGWKDFGGAMAPAKIVADARRMAVLRGRRDERRS